MTMLSVSRYPLLALLAFALLAGCDSGSPDPEAPPRPVAPQVVGATYVNKSFSSDHLDLAAAEEAARGGSEYVRLVDLTLEFADGVEPADLQRLRVFGTYSRDGYDGGGTVGVGWEWSGTALDTLVADGRYLLLPDLFLPDDAEGDAILNVFAEADTVATYDFLHKTTFAELGGPYETFWRGVDEVEARLYLSDGAASSSLELVWLNADGSEEVGRSEVTEVASQYESLRIRATGAPASAGQAYVEATGTMQGVSFLSRSRVVALPARIPNDAVFLEGIDGEIFTEWVRPADESFLVRYLTPNGSSYLVRIGVDGVVSAPHLLRDEPVQIGASADGRLGWLAYQNGAIDRVDFATGTATRFFTVGGTAYGIADLGTAVVVSACETIGSGCEAVLLGLDRDTGALVHRVPTGPVFRDFSYDAATGTAIAHSAHSYYGTLLDISPSGELLDYRGEVAVSGNVSGYTSYWHFLPTRGEWITPAGTVHRVSDGEEIGRYRLNPPNQSSGDAAHFSSNAGTNRVVALRRANSYPSGSVDLVVFALDSRERLRRVPMPGRGAYGLLRSDSGYVGLVSSGDRLFLLPIADSEVDPARRTRTAPVFPR